MSIVELIKGFFFPVLIGSFDEFRYASCKIKFINCSVEVLSLSHYEQILSTHENSLTNQLITKRTFQNFSKILKLKGLKKKKKS